MKKIKQSNAIVPQWGKGGTISEGVNTKGLSEDT